MSEPSPKDNVVPLPQLPPRLDADPFAARAATIPALKELAKLKHWLMWQPQRVNGRWTKVPFQAANGLNASSTNPKHWSTLEACLAKLREGIGHGVGFVTTEDDPYVLVDLDKCRDPATGDLEAWAAEAVKDLASYAEASPTGTGVHVIVRATLPEAGAKTPKVEMYQVGRYFTFTGAHLSDTPDEINEAQDAAERLWWRYCRPERGTGTKAAGDGATVELPADAPVLAPELLEEFLTDPKAKRTWNLKRPEFKKADGSPDWSSYDLSLATLAADVGFSNGSIWALLVAFRHKQGTVGDVQKALRRDYAERTIATARASVAKRQAELAAAEADPRPLLWVQPGRVSENVDDSVAALNSAPFDLGVFQRGPDAVVVRLVETAETLPGRRGERYEASLAAGSAVLRKAEAEHVIYGLERTRRAVKPGKGAKPPVAADVPLHLARVVLRNATFRPVLRAVRQPTLRANGSILATPGYDPTSGLVYWPGEDFPEVGSDLSLDAAKETIKRLTHPFRKLPFVDPVDQAVLLAEALTIATRHLYVRAPGFLHRAPEPRTGKTLAADAIAILASGAQAANVSGAVLTDEPELRKLLTTWALAGTAVGLFDNVERGSVVDSNDLSRFLTAGSYGDRILGTNTGAEAPVVTTVVLTGNAVGIGGETAHRFLTVDLDARCEDPSKREIDFDLEEEIRRDRPDFVVALLTLVCAYRAAGSPPLGLKPFGGFEDWSRWVRAPLVFAGLPDPCLTLAKHTDIDEGRLEVGEVLARLVPAFAGARFTATDVMEAVTIKLSQSEAFPPLRTAILQVAASKEDRDRPSRERIGHFLRKHVGRMIGGLRLAYVPDTVVKTSGYRLERISKS